MTYFKNDFPRVLFKEIQYVEESEYSERRLLKVANLCGFILNTNLEFHFRAEMYGKIHAPHNKGDIAE